MNPLNANMQNSGRILEPVTKEKLDIYISIVHFGPENIA
jgi:hypothetical protein